MFYAVYDPSASPYSAILRAGFCTKAADASIQAKSGEAALITAFLADNTKYKIDTTTNPPTVVSI